MNYIAKYKNWLESDYFDLETKEELKLILNDKREIEDRFYKNLEFGTGGLRGKIGAGTNRINKYTVRRVTEGLSRYINSTLKGEKSVVIAYDSRFKSDEFCKEAACVLVRNGIKTYIFDDLRSTPELSFAVRYLKCSMGIVITASHNPKEYNGYKVYDSNGGQICIDVANNIISLINDIDNFEDINTTCYDKALKEGMIKILGAEIDTFFIDAVKEQIINRDIIKKYAADLKIVYTPIHGTGLMPISRVFKESGFSNFYVVEEQKEPDSEFSTVEYPNPEEESVFNYAKDLSEKVCADIILGTDPDCDRVGVIVKDKNSKYRTLNGNQIGALLVRYILDNSNIDKMINPVIVKTIVTSELGSVIAKEYGVNTINTLTGFKFIGEKVNQFEINKSHTFIMGYEESYGYLVGTHVRDKDRVVSSLIIAELATYCKSQGISMYEYLIDTYKKYGYYSEVLKSITIEGKEGIEKIKDIMKYFRYKNLNELGFENIKERKDYILGIENLPKADVLKFVMDDGGWFAVRPSGTEPKIKIYLSANALSESEVNNKISSMYGKIVSIVESI